MSQEQPRSVAEMDLEARIQLALAFELLFNALPESHQRFLEQYGAADGLAGPTALAKLLDAGMHVENINRMMEGNR